MKEIGKTPDRGAIIQLTHDETLVFARIMRTLGVGDDTSRWLEGDLTKAFELMHHWIDLEENVKYLEAAVAKARKALGIGHI